VPRVLQRNTQVGGLKTHEGRMENNLPTVVNQVVDFCRLAMQRNGRDATVIVDVWSLAFHYSWRTLRQTTNLKVESRKGARPGPTGSRWFPFPAHQTGRADFPHPAFRQISPQAHGRGPRCTSRNRSTPNVPNTTASE
jgi:hypothetical protein